MFIAPLAFVLAAQPLLVRKSIIRPQPPAVAAKPALSEEQILKNVHLDTSGAALLDFFRQRAAPSVEKERLVALIKQLSDKTPAVHGKATAELVGLGPLALPALRGAALGVDDEETAQRARKCVESIEGHNGAELVQSAIRLLASRRPEGAADALLTYLPVADNETVVEEIESALLAVGLRENKAESALMRSLTDPVPVRRSIAARVLCRVGGTAGHKAVHPLLKDARPSVRMQAALGLADTHDAESVPVLIDLVAALPLEERKKVEGYLTELAGEWAIKTPQGNDAMAGRLRRELWSAWWRSMDGKELLEEFRSRTLSDVERTRVLALIGKLGDASPDVRAKAAEDIIGLGSRAAPLLRRIVGEAPARVAAAVRQCLQTIERDTAKPLPDAAPRLLALRRPEGAVEALLGYLPFAESDASSAQLVDLLASIGCIDGKANPALVRALRDKVAIRRAAAAAALCKGGADDEMPAVRKLLADTDVLVRLRTAVALAERGEKSAVPVLIGLLTDLPPERLSDVEDLLSLLAGDKGPVERITGDAASRKASVAAWKAWWSKEEKNVDLAKLRDASRDRGLLLVIEMQQGRVLELTRSGQVRWKIEGLQWPWDACVCPNGNVLVLNQSGNQASMRDRQGKELWVYHFNNQAFECQRLRNGHFFIIGRNRVAEIDANGKEVSARFLNIGHIIGGCKFANGHLAVINHQGQYYRYDAAGKQVKSFQVPYQWQNGVQGAELLPGDRVVVSLSIGKVAEYSDGGKLVWEATVANPGFPHRLRNGHTLVSPMNQTSLVELDRAGKVVSEKKDFPYRPFRVRRR